MTNKFVILVIFLTPADKTDTNKALKHKATNFTMLECFEPANNKRGIFKFESIAKVLCGAFYGEPQCKYIYYIVVYKNESVGFL